MIIMEKKWRTKIADSGEGGTVIRGYDLVDLIGVLSFSEMVFLLLKEEKPTKEQKEMMDAILVSFAEHGIAVPSVTSARTVFSGGNPMNAAVAAGILAIGDHHGGAIEQAAKLLQENKGKDAGSIVKEYYKKRIPGYGHKIYTTDPRSTKLLEIAKRNNISGRHVELALQIEKALEETTGEKLCLNVDGAVAAIVSDMGFDWRLGKGFFIIGRTAGLVAHIHEEWVNEKPFRRLDKEEYEYTGKK